MKWLLSKKERYLVRLSTSNDLSPNVINIIIRDRHLRTHFHLSCLSYSLHSLKLLIGSSWGCTISFLYTESSWGCTASFPYTESSWGCTTSFLYTESSWSCTTSFLYTEFSWSCTVSFLYTNWALLRLQGVCSNLTEHGWRYAVLGGICSIY